MDQPHLLDLTLDDLDNGKLQVTEIWEVDMPSPDQFHVLFKHMETLTATQITIDKTTKKISVSGKDTATVKLALGRLSKLHTALTLSQHLDNRHHIFPPKGYDQLQMMSFRAHSTAATIRSLSTELERELLSSMVVLIPLKPLSRKRTMPVTPRHPSSSSRYWQAFEFQGFTNVESSQVNSTSLRPPVSNDVSRVVLIDTSPLTTPEKADLVKKWVDLSSPSVPHNPSLADSFDIEALEPVSIEKPAEEPKNIRGLLVRRARPRCHQTMAQKTAPGTPAAKKQLTLDDLWEFAKVKNWQVKDTDASTEPSAPSAEPSAPSAEPSAPSVKIDDEEVPKASRNEIKENPVPSTTETAAETVVEAVTEQNPEQRKCELRPSISEFAPTEPSPPSTKPNVSFAESSSSKAEESVAVPQKEVMEVSKRKVNRRGDAHEVQEIFDAMQPVLEAAKCFPGALELELHIELVVVPPFSDHRRRITPGLSIEEWKEVFQPGETRPQCSFLLWNKLTASGPDVDAMVDMKWSQKRGDRMFEDEPTDRTVVYEFHCRMENGLVFVITLDEKGRPTFQEPESALSSSTVHVPHRTWDLNLVLKGSMNLYHHLQDRNLKAAIDNFVKSIKLEPDSNLYIYCIQPKEIFSVDKILMKRWTRHKHLPADRQEKSNLMLKILEVQEFYMVPNSLNKRAIRGRIPLLEREEWAKHQLLWFEVSIASDDIEKLLASNRDLELGEQTQKWKPVDLLGDEVELKDIPVESNAVAKAIGNSGLGYMYRLGKSILDRMTIGES